MGRLTTHVLDTSTGRPADGLKVELFRERQPDPLVTAVTNSDGRLNDPLLEAEALTADRYELRFHVAHYFRTQGVTLTDPPFLDIVPIRFGIADTTVHYHVRLLISPYGYSTYRGS